MKQACNFRLSEQTLDVLSVLQKKLHCSKTTIIEKAVIAYAQQSIPHRNTLLQFAGVLSASDSEEMLKAIEEKYNKKMDLDL